MPPCEGALRHMESATRSYTFIQGGDHRERMGNARTQ